MIPGVTDFEQHIITKILDIYKQNYSFYYYGSRVKGNYNKNSDLDILIKGDKEMPLSDLASLKEQMDDSKLPYIVNFTDFSTINENFYNLIKDDLILIE